MTYNLREQLRIRKYFKNNLYVWTLITIAKFKSVQSNKQHNLSVYFFHTVAHVFFDDAFDPHACKSIDFRVNDFVKLLMKVVDVAARQDSNDVTLEMT